ncbi:MAG: DUF2807 domain-containing protein [Muribaculaceae bacterium]|nr:DUF2807 domain-containing protein [Muribaculaceae bacterium]
MKSTRFIHTHTQSLMAVAAVVVFTAFGAILMWTLSCMEASAEAISPVNEQKQASSGKIMPTSREIAISSFNGINVSNAIEVVFSQGDNPGVAKIKASESGMKNLELTVKDGVLTARQSSTSDNNTSKVVVTVSSPMLYSIKTSTASSVTVNGMLETDGEITVDASTASSVSFGEVSAKKITVEAKTASNVFFLVTEADALTVNAATAADVRLRGMSVASVNAKAESAAEITLSGRCNKSSVKSLSGGEVKTRGLILEQMPITKAAYPAGRTFQP